MHVVREWFNERTVQWENALMRQWLSGNDLMEEWLDARMIGCDNELRRES